MKKYFNKYIVILLVFLNINISNAQNSIPEFISNPTEYIQNNFNIFDSIGYLVPVNDNLIALNYLNNNKENFGFNSDLNFQVISTKNDMDRTYIVRDKLTHTKYQQYYKNIPIEHAQSYIHSRNGNIAYMNLKVLESFNKSEIPTVSATSALTILIDSIGINLPFNWLDSAKENELKSETNNSNATYYPTPQLLYAKKSSNGIYLESDYELAWAIKIIIDSLNLNSTFYVSAETGNVIKKTTNICNDGPAATLYYGSRTIDTKARGFPYDDHILHTDGNLRNLHTKIKGNSGSFNLWSNVDDSNDNWASSDADATTSHLCASQAWDFFSSTFGWSGVQGNNSNKVQVVVDAAIPNNAFYQNLPFGVDRIKIGQTSFGDLLSTIDVIGHEFAHGVTEYSADLVYESESGALNESFSDIFGQMSEIQFNNGIQNWTMGEDANFTIRNLSLPTQFGQPAFYQEPPQWFVLNNCIPCCDPLDADFNDCCGVHTNSGVQNYWYFLLSMGSANAATVNNIPVTGISTASAGIIAFHSLTNFLTDNSQYVDAQINSILSAITLFGQCSNEHIQTINAWAAVGIGNPSFPLALNVPTLSSLYYFTPITNLPITVTATNGFFTGNPNYTWTTSSNVIGSASGSNNEFYTITALAPLNSTSTQPFLGSFIQVNDNCASLSRPIKVQPLLIYNNGGGTTTTGTGGGIKKLTGYPNPTNDYLNITVNEAEWVSTSATWDATILNTNGVVVYALNDMETLTTNYNLISLPNGEYNFILTRGTEMASIKIIKR